MALRGGGLNAHLANDLHRDYGIRQHSVGALHLGRTHRRLSPSPVAHRRGLLKPRERALERQLSFEVRHGREDMKDETPAKRGGVDRLRDHLEPGFALLQVGGRLH